MFDESKFLDPEVDKFVLQKIQSAVELSLSPTELKTVELSSYMDWMTDMLMYKLRWLTAGRVKEFAVYPNWWEGFKDKFFPTWLKKKFPVKTETIHVYQLFPDVPIWFKESYVEFASIQGFGSLKVRKDAQP